MEYPLSLLSSIGVLLPAPPDQLSAAAAQAFPAAVPRPLYAGEAGGRVVGVRLPDGRGVVPPVPRGVLLPYVPRGVVDPREK